MSISLEKGSFLSCSTRDHFYFALTLKFLKTQGDEVEVLEEESLWELWINPVTHIEQFAKLKF